MIGFYDYTVILTYLSLLSAGTGIFISLSGQGHAYIGAFFLLFCGLCDAFDGKVARTKKNRTEMECHYGIQIDSLSDLVAFGVLPACIGGAAMRTSPLINHIGIVYSESWETALRILLSAVMVLYILAALIRLAYFNVTEEERQKTEGGARKVYTGLPVTASSLIFPLVLLLQFLTPCDLVLVYFATACIVGFAFLSKIQIRKPGMRGILIMVGIGAVEFLLILIASLLEY